MRGAKKEVLRLLTTFIEKAGAPEAPPLHVAQAFLPPMLDPILGDYHVSVRVVVMLVLVHVLLSFGRLSAAFLRTTGVGIVLFCNRLRDCHRQLNAWCRRLFLLSSFSLSLALILNEQKHRSFVDFFPPRSQRFAIFDCVETDRMSAIFCS